MKLYAQAFGLFLVSTCAARAASAQDPAATRLDPNAPYSAEKKDPVKYRVDFRAVVTAPYGTKVLRVWLPIPPSDNAQIVEKSYLESFPQKVQPSVGVEKVFGNRFAYFEFPDPRGAQMITHRFEITVHELRFHIAPEKVSTVAKWPEDFTPFLRSESQAVVINGSVRALAGQIVPAAINPLADLKKVIGWVESNLRYDHSKASLHASSEWALEQRAGHCSDYHGLCSAFTRALGYPARVTYGINTFAKNSPSHCKLEVYLPGYDWVSFDVSETQRLCAKIAADASLSGAVKESLIARARERLFSGFRDNTWYLQTRGTDYDLVPPASRRVAVVRTIYAEADGQPLPEPDPGDATKQEFAWMTLHSFEPDHAVTYPFNDASSLGALQGGD